MSKRQVPSEPTVSEGSRLRLTPVSLWVYTLVVGISAAVADQLPGSDLKFSFLPIGMPGLIFTLAGLFHWLFLRFGFFAPERPAMMLAVLIGALWSAIGVVSGAWTLVFKTLYLVLLLAIPGTMYRVATSGRIDPAVFQMLRDSVWIMLILICAISLLVLAYH